MNKKDIDIVAEILAEILSEKGLVKPENNDFTVPIGISNRHIHLSRKDLDTCFGEGYELTPMKDLSQPGQYASKETMLVCGPKGVIENVRILGPIRKDTQVELLAGDNFKLGIKAPLRLSGDIEGSAPVTLIGPKASVNIEKGAMIAKRHIHMTTEDAKNYGVHDGQIVSVEIDGERGGRIDNVIIRANDKSKLDFHIDTEEANALGIVNGTVGRIIMLDFFGGQE